MMARASGLRTFRLATLILVSCLATSACAWLDTDAQRGYAERGHWDDNEPRVYTTADIRMIIRRTHPQTGQEVTCTEPTPDVAKALSTASAFTAQGSSKAGASGQLGASGGSAEAVAELAGRSTALIALRDGLYRTCEAYVNGAIGSDAYALVLSRYGQLMTTLFLGEDIRGAAALTNTTPPSSPALVTVTSGPAAQVGNDSPPSSATTENGGSGGDDGKGGHKKSSTTVNVAPDFLKVASRYEASSSPGRAGPKLLIAAADTNSTPESSTATKPDNKGTAPADKGAPADSSDKTAKSDKTKKSDKQNSGSQSSDDTQPAASTSPSAVAAVSLVRMNEDYFDLDVNFIHQLVLACINEYDPTRVRMRVAKTSGTPAEQIQQILQNLRSQERDVQDQQAELNEKQQDLKAKEAALEGEAQQLEQRMNGMQANPKLKKLPLAGTSAGSTSDSTGIDAAVALLNALPENPPLIDTTGPGQNAWLRHLCASLGNVQTVVAAEHVLLDNLKTAGHPAADVRPDIGLGAPADSAKDPPTTRGGANSGSPSSTQPLPGKT